ncbi:uroporphyrinogen-III synthase [compost metagenome]
MTGEDDDELLKLLEEGRIHAVTFTSSSTVRNFLDILKRMGLHDPLPLLEPVKIACIGPLTEKTAAEAGLKPGLLAEEATIDSLVDALCRWNENLRKL